MIETLPQRRPAAMLLLLLAGGSAIIIATSRPQPSHIFARGLRRSVCYPSTSCFSGCLSETRGHFVPVEKETIGCGETCCPAQPPPGTCYFSDKCGVGCSPGYLSVAQNGLCEDLCCVPGSSFWLDKCFVDCPAGYRSVQKQGCLDLCEPMVPPGGAYPGGTYPSQFPGQADGFARGIDASGAEVYRYEREGLVYIVPSSDYYAWRSQHNGATEAALNLLLLGAAFHVMSYPHSTYYSSHHVFTTPTAPYYASPAYQTHYAGAHAYGGAVGGAHTPVAQARPLGAGAHPVATGTPVATAHPVAGCHPVATGTPVATGHPVATAKPVSTPTPAPAPRPAPRPAPHYAPRPTSHWSTARTAYHTTRGRRRHG